MSFQTGFKTYLTKKLTKTATTIYVQTLPTATSGRMEIYNGTQKEWINYSGIAGTNPTGSLTGVTRDMSQTAMPSTGSGTGLAWQSGTPLIMVVMHDQYDTNTGTVTSVSVTTANGVSGSVATDTTTPAISITLGAITPTSVVASGAVSGSNLSGTNTGDQTNITGNAGTVTNGVYLTATQTLQNKRITQRVITTTDDASSVIDIDTTDVYELTAVANNTTFTLTGTPTDGQKLIVRYKDAGVSKTLTWTGFTAIGVTLPTATTVSKWGYVGCIYNTSASTWHAVAVTTQA